MAKSKPTVFIGSSHESLCVVETIAKALKDAAEVRPWTDTDIFPPGGIILNSLLRHAQLFDFAVMVFGPDDIVLSGGDEILVPRDNVVFELGLFMSQLGQERALLVVPNALHRRIKILSDLGGLKAVDYEPPKTNSPEDLTRALREPIRQIRTRIKNIGVRPMPPSVVHQGPKDVLDIGTAATELFEQAWKDGRVATVRNISLDMGSTWDIINGRLLDNPNVRNLDWRSVMIDPVSRAIKDVGGRTVSTKLASERIKQIQRTCSLLKEQLETRKVSFECRGYGTVPVIHGFLINGSVLFLTMTRIDNGELIGAPNAYLKFVASPGQESISHAFRAFSDWFEQLWTHGSAIWPMRLKV